MDVVAPAQLEVEVLVDWGLVVAHAAVELAFWVILQLQRAVLLLLSLILFQRCPQQM